MKKLLIILIISLVYNSNIFAAEEIRSRFGFYISVPDKFVAVQDQNIDELLKLYKDSDINKSAFNDLMSGISKDRMNIEYFFPTHLDPASNSLNINIQKGNIAEIIELGMTNVCPYYQKEYSKIFKKNIRQHKCNATKKLRPKFNSAIFLKHDRPSPPGFLIQYQFNTKGGSTTFTAGCDFKNCEQMDSYAKKMIKSIRQ